MSDRVNRFISILYRYGQRFIARELKPAGLEAGQMPALIQIERNPGITQECISANTGMDKGTTARSVQQLERMGYCVRQEDPEDRRVNHIYPTPAGKEGYAEVMRVTEHLHEVLYQGFDEAEIEQTLALLRRMTDNIAQYMLKEQGKRTTL